MSAKRAPPTYGHRAFSDSETRQTEHAETTGLPPNADIALSVALAKKKIWTERQKSSDPPLHLHDLVGGVSARPPPPEKHAEKLRQSQHAARVVAVRSFSRVDGNHASMTAAAAAAAAAAPPILAAANLPCLSHRRRSRCRARVDQAAASAVGRE